MSQLRILLISSIVLCLILPIKLVFGAPPYDISKVYRKLSKSYQKYLIKIETHFGYISINITCN